MKKDKIVKVCPKCGSINVLPEGGANMTGGVSYYCGDCDYGNFRNEPTTLFFPEIKEKDLKSFQRDLKKNKNK